jgi:acetyl-CoA carboxylase biotin carboxyl carrier protein
MDLRKIQKLIELVQTSGIGELEITEGEERIRINRGVGGTQLMMPQQPIMVDPTMLSNTGVFQTLPQQQPPGSALAPPAAAPASAPVPAGNPVKSPMVGTFYRSSSPGAAPFVEVGATVTKGQTLCIIEAMKLLNEIESDRAGVVKQILADNGQPVEYGQTLFIIE